MEFAFLALALVLGIAGLASGQRQNNATIEAQKANQRQAYNDQIRLADYQNKLNKENSDYEFNRNAEYNSPSAIMSRYQAAGLNPNLIYQNSYSPTSMSIPGASIPSLSGDYSTPNLPFNAGDYLGNMAKNIPGMGTDLLASIQNSQYRDAKIQEQLLKNIDMQQELGFNWNVDATGNPLESQEEGFKSILKRRQQSEAKLAAENAEKYWKHQANEAQERVRQFNETLSQKQKEHADLVAQQQTQNKLSEKEFYIREKQIKQEIEKSKADVENARNQVDIARQNEEHANLVNREIDNLFTWDKDKTAIENLKSKGASLGKLGAKKLFDAKIERTSHTESHSTSTAGRDSKGRKYSSQTYNKTNKTYNTRKY